MTRVLDVLLKFLMASCMALMVGVVTWQVFSRYVLGDPAAWTEEVARMLLIWVGLLGGVYAYRLKAHLGLDLLRMNAGPAGLRRLDVIADVSCGLFALAVLVIGVLLFGKNLPNVGRSLGKSLMEFKKGLDDIKSEVNSATYSEPSRSPAALATTATASTSPFASMFMRRSRAFFGSGSNAMARPNRPVRSA